MNEDSWQTLHERACRAGEEFYVDPGTGWRVFTEVGLRRRGSCCGSGCRHCPMRTRKSRWKNVPASPAGPPG